MNQQQTEPPVLPGGCPQRIPMSIIMNEYELGRREVFGHSNHRQSMIRDRNRFESIDPAQEGRAFKR